VCVEYNKGHGFKSWKQPFAEVQGKTVYIRPKVVRPFSDPMQVGATCTRLPLRVQQKLSSVLNDLLLASLISLCRFHLSILLKDELNGTLMFVERTIWHFWLS
jgi:hypothetical protein